MGLPYAVVVCVYFCNVKEVYTLDETRNVTR